jgi:hypothetical protein
MAQVEHTFMLRTHALLCCGCVRRVGVGCACVRHCMLDVCVSRCGNGTVCSSAPRAPPSELISVHASPQADVEYPACEAALCNSPACTCRATDTRRLQRATKTCSIDVPCNEIPLMHVISLDVCSKDVPHLLHATCEAKSDTKDKCLH